VYLGMIRHKEKTFPGKHPAIIDQSLWDKVQDLLQSASVKRRGAPSGQTSKDAVPLKGKFRDETGDLLTPTHARKNGKQLRYYISNRLVSGGADPT
ncbi:recombinase family protein, partial [Tropicimonas sp. IMCC6043]|uniref:recombinase family protein n=1 Tax=Tropicimonas sp. IMCC6043 TaxID=2510645 RepID=UPI0010DE7F34